MLGTRLASLLAMLFVSLGILSMAALPAVMSAHAFHTFGGTYVVDIIPGAAQRDSLYHYYPPVIAVPAGTEVSWFNGDPEQPHTVTSGSPREADAGAVFNSGVMSYQYFFVYQFDQAGDYPYYCTIHPWRFGVVHVSDELEAGNNFEFSAGTGVSSWNISEFERNLLKFEPTTVALDESTPATYNLSITDAGTEEVVHSASFPSTNNLLVELITGGNETSTWGPDRASTIHSTPGAYHVQGNFTQPGTYLIDVAVTAVDGQPLQSAASDQFTLEITE